MTAVRQVAVVKEQPRPLLVRVDIEMVDSGGIKGTGAADETVYFIVFTQQQFCQIRAVLTGNAGY